MWIQLHDTFLDHRKVKRLCDDLNVTSQNVTVTVTVKTVTMAEVRGHLVTLWLNVLRHACDGNLSEWDDTDICNFSEWTGQPKAWVDALVKWGFIQSDGTDRSINDWAKYCGLNKEMDKRVADRERKRRSRERLRENPLDPQPSQEVTVTVTDVTPEKRREEKRVKEKTTSHGASAFPIEFERLWQSRPRRSGGDNKQKALHAWNARRREGHTAESMQSGMDRYRAYCEETEKIGTEYVKQTATFLGKGAPFCETWEVAMPQRTAQGAHEAWALFRRVLCGGRQVIDDPVVKEIIRRWGGLDRLGQTRSFDLDRRRDDFDRLFTELKTQGVGAVDAPRPQHVHGGI